MIKLMYIPSMEKFAKALDNCQGRVLLHLPDNTTCDLRSNPVAIQMLKLLPSGYTNTGLCLSFSDPHDSDAFLRYVMGNTYG